MNKAKIKETVSRWNQMAKDGVNVKFAGTETTMRLRNVEINDEILLFQGDCGMGGEKQVEMHYTQLHIEIWEVGDDKPELY